MDRTHRTRSIEAATSPGSAAVSRRARLRDDLEQVILGEAERVFADKGFDGATVSDIAEAAGLSKQNLMYYFPSKQALYERVLDDVLDDWLRSMNALAHSDLPMPQALRLYIQAKLEFSRRRPAGSRVYALEVISGAKQYAQQIKSKVVPVLRKDIATLNRWMEPRQVKVSAEHLMFAIWAATQSYADFATQMQLVTGRSSLSDAFFAQAQETLTQMVLGALGSAEASA
ncbi:TetR/AcrR family transcriptional regulator [Pseudorhodoferax sp.]|uniref:TetR/AcrR family transcriptional regulator n=1 Tax=Pseudorhodoferax sp. TaxID=1993553 RepID=UPI002DD690B0|nr:TetR/AcrR family transcriptional regulator [Pseudorhodoferax sp.]